MQHLCLIHVKHRFRSRWTHNTKFYVKQVLTRSGPPRMFGAIVGRLGRA